MSPRLSSLEIFERAEKACDIGSSCGLCPRQCRVDRTAGETGYCAAGPQPSIAAAAPHFGEEPPLTGSGGAGALFFTRCNLRCVYCQNFQISQGPCGEPVDPEELCEKMLAIDGLGCSNLELVSPTHHLPGILEALASAVGKGLSIPVVYNSNGYESPETLELLDGIVDIYLPDLKYASNEHAARLSDSADYVQTARSAIVRMHNQVGNLVLDLQGRAVKGLILRHLVLPGDLSGTRETLFWAHDHLPLTVTISLMAQYSPIHRSAAFPPLDRGIVSEEYDRAVDLAWELGFENVFIQDLESRTVGIPDFHRSNPFEWDPGCGRSSPD
jgi:putative pyruvate formate lyase activating enzyme